MDMVVSELLGLESSWTPFAEVIELVDRVLRTPEVERERGIRIWVKNLYELKCGGIEIEREWAIEAMVIA